VDFVDKIEAFAREEIKPRAKAIDSEGVFDSELLKKLAENGLLSLVFPKSLGGMGLDPVSYGLVFERAAKYCSNVKNLLLVNVAMVGGALLEAGTKEQINFWIPQIMAGKKVGAFSLTEESIGSDLYSMETSFTKVSQGFKINGRKTWTTLGGIADFFLVAAKCNQTTGVFIVESDRRGVTRRQLTGLLGNRGSHIAEINLNEVIIPEGALVGRIEPGTNKVIATALDLGRYSTAWSGVALGQACLEEMISYSRSRTQFGNKIRSYQLIQELIGRAATNIQASRALALEAGKLRKSKGAKSIHHTNMAKYFCSRVARDISNDAVQLHGANGYTNDFPVERYFRDAKALEIIEGTSQILIQLIAQKEIST
jgi:alkylation response protein AidB-like acyl-CoA dehydrogenase